MCEAHRGFASDIRCVKQHDFHFGVVLSTCSVAFFTYGMIDLNGNFGVVSRVDSVRSRTSYMEIPCKRMLSR